MLYVERLSQARLVCDRLRAEWRRAYAPEYCSRADSKSTGSSSRRAWAELRGDTRAEPRTAYCGACPSSAMPARLLRKMFPDDRAEAYAKANVRVDEAVAAVLGALSAPVRARVRPSVDALLRAHQGQPSSFVSALVLALFGLEDGGRLHRLYGWLGASGIGPESWARLLKRASDIARKTGNTPWGHDPDAPVWYYGLADLAGRGVGAVDWAAERAKREHEPPAGPAADPDLLRTFRQRARTNLGALLGTALARFRPRGVDEMWALRHQWTATGSAAKSATTMDPSNFTVDGRRVEGEPETVRLNKKAYSEALDERWLHEVLASQPQLVSETSEKLEHAKRRALYSSDVPNYFATHYVLYQLEGVLDSPLVDLRQGGDAALIAIERRAREAAGDACGWMYDFADFNAQHGPNDIAATIGLAERAVMGDDAQACSFKQACRWAAAAVHNTTARDPTSGGTYQVQWGLQSGWRGTSWANTLLNVAYITTVAQTVTQATGRWPLVRSQHSGDDVYGLTPTWVDAVAMSDYADKCGLRAQPDKVLIDSGAEYLRVSYDESTPAARGYPLRAVASLVSGNWITPVSNDVAGRARAVAEHVGNCHRRGMRRGTADRLLTLAVTRWSTVTTPVGRVSAPAIVRHTSSSRGGWGIPDRHGRLWGGQLPAQPTAILALPDTDALPTMASKARADQAVAALRRVGATATHAMLVERFAQASYAGVAPQAVRQAIERANNRLLADWYGRCESGMRGPDITADRCTRRVAAEVDHLVRTTFRPEAASAIGSWLRTPFRDLTSPADCRRAGLNWLDGLRAHDGRAAAIAERVGRVYGQQVAWDVVTRGNQNAVAGLDVPAAAVRAAYNDAIRLAYICQVLPSNAQQCGDAIAASWPLWAARQDTIVPVAI